MRSYKVRYLSLVIIIVLGIVTPSFGDEVASRQGTLSDTFSAIVAQSDQLLHTRDVSGNLAQSIDLLLPLLPSPNSLSIDQKYLLLWNLARRCSEVRFITHLNKSQRLDYFEQGERFALAAQSLRPKGIQGLYWYGILLGRAAEERGILDSLFSVGPIHDTMKTIIDIDPTFHRAYFVLARLHRKAPPFISIGDTEKAKDYIHKAIQLAPKETYYPLELGHIHQARGERESAISAYQKVLDLPIREGDFLPVIHENKAKAQKALDDLKD